MSNELRTFCRWAQAGLVVAIIIRFAVLDHQDWGWVATMMLAWGTGGVAYRKAA